jgi:L-asparaginase
MVKKTRKIKKKNIKKLDEKLTKEKSFTLIPTEGGPTPKNKNQELQFKISSKSRKNSKNNKSVGGRVYILYTGGTIGMSHPSDEEGLVPIKGTLIKLIKKLNLDVDLKIEYLIDRIDPLIDSSDLTAKDWLKMIKQLEENYDKYDSFIVLHGTDTLAYTCSILSFFLKDWQKPVVITGSQIPLFEFRNDARSNVIDSIIVSLLKIPEVLLVFGGEIIRASCVSKVNSTAFDAFASPNEGKLGDIGVHINIYKDKITNWNMIKKDPMLKDNPITEKYINKLSNNKWKLNQWTNDIKIDVLTLLPHKNAPILEKLIELNPDAIILKTYGIGNAPVSDTEFVNTLKKAIAKGIIIVNNTQCLYGGVNQNYYHTGKELKTLGIIGSKNMTDAAVYSKLFYLFQIFGKENRETIEKLFQISIVGEITVNTFFHDNLENNLVNYFNQYQEFG